MGEVKQFDPAAAGRKGAESRRRKSALINAKGQARDRRQPGEVRSLTNAIASFCAECCGFDPGGCGSMRAAVEDCLGPLCHLYLYRNGVFHLDEAEAEVQAIEDEAKAS